MKSIYTVIKQSCNPKRAESCQKYFKTGPGEYAEGDKFLGITNPQARLIAKEFKHLNLNEVEFLVKSQYHEERFIGLLILIEKFRIKVERKQIYEFYMNNLKYVNNWDLVDLSAPSIVGVYLIEETKSKEILYELCKSEVIWERRISIISTLTFIRASQYEDCLKLAKLLLKDQHDLIQKAVGWMLREVGKKEVSLLEKFIQEHYELMPRTTLRYSIEKFSENKRKQYLKGEF